MCNGVVVKQVHLGQTGEREEVVLGVWSMEAHREWFRRTGNRKMSKRWGAGTTHYMQE